MFGIGVRWGMVVVAVASLASCSSSHPSSGGGGAGGAPPDLESSAGDSAAGNSAAGAVTELPVAEGTCAVSRSIAVHAGAARINRIVRTDWGFVADSVSDLGAVPTWQLLSADGARQRTVQLAWSGPPSVLADLPFATAFEHLAPVFLTPVAAAGYDSRLQSWPLTPPGGTPADVGYYFDRATTTYAVASSFDGQRGLFVSAHPSTEPPHAVLLDSTGARVGDELVLDPPLVTCLAATPTAHAAAFSFVDPSGAAPVLQLVMFGADGAVSRVTLPAAPDDCPSVQSDGEGLLVTASFDGRFQAYSVAAGATQASPLLTQAPLLSDLTESAHAALWAARAQDGGLSVYGSHAGKGQIAQVAQSGAITWLATDVDLPSVVGNVIPSAAGELFLDLRVSDPDTGAETRYIDQITCNAVGFSSP